MPEKQRLDQHLLNKGIVATRQKAQQIIRAGLVRGLNGQVLDKPGLRVPSDLELNVKTLPRFVSRGGEKLLAALEAFQINVEGKVCLDGGISTGGFTDCLLQHGAIKVYGVDVGYGQTAWNIRKDPRVILLERTNLRKLSSDDLYKSSEQRASLAVADLSFISLKIILPVLKTLLSKDDPEALLLIKPQFEVGKKFVGKGGVVRDLGAHLFALEGVIEASINVGFFPKGLIPSPLTGPAGNHEYLLWLSMKANPFTVDLKQLVKATLN